MVRGESDLYWSLSSERDLELDTDQSEASIQVTWPVLTNQRPVSLSGLIHFTYVHYTRTKHKHSKHCWYTFIYLLAFTLHPSSNKLEATHYSAYIRSSKGTNASLFHIDIGYHIIIIKCPASSDIDQSEAGLQVTWSVSANQRPVSHDYILSVLFASILSSLFLVEQKTINS